MKEDIEIREAYGKDHRLEDLKVIASTEQGRNYLWWLMGRTHMFSSTFTGNSNSAFLEGERNIGLMVFRDLAQVNPKLLGDMAQAHADMLRRIEKEKKDAGR